MNTVSDMSQLKLTDFEEIVNTKYVLNAARTTSHKEFLDKIPSDEFLRFQYLAEHSPIRLQQFVWKWVDLQQWITVHFVRHHEGILKYIGTQRPDRNKDILVPRDELAQGALNDMMCCANAQGIINISRVRLCHQASVETTYAWKMVLDSVAKVAPMLASCCVPECIYRGFCPELQNSCGYSKTDDYKQKLKIYREGITKN